MASSRGRVEVGAGTIVAAGDDSSDVGAVSVEVQIAKVIAGAIERKVGSVYDLSLASEPVDRDDAGVDQGDGDARTRISLRSVRSRVDDLGVDVLHGSVGRFVPGFPSRSGGNRTDPGPGAFFNCQHWGCHVEEEGEDRGSNRHPSPVPTGHSAFDGGTNRSRRTRLIRKVG